MRSPRTPITSSQGGITPRRGPAAAAAPPAVMYGEHLLKKTSSNFAL